MKIVKTENRMIHCEDLAIAPAYQRTIVPPQVSRIVREFDNDAFGSLVVGQREDGSLWVVDGLQRLTAARKLGIQRVPCDVFASEGQKHEAKIFRLKNKNRTNVSAIVLFRALIAEGDDESLEIRRIARKVGLKIGEQEAGPRWPNIRCVTAVQRVYGRGNLEQTLEIICAAWPEDEDALNGHIVEGLSIFLQKCSEVDVRELVRKLREKTPADVLRFADGVRKLMSNAENRASVVASGFLKFYNFRRHKRVKFTDGVLA